MKRVFIVGCPRSGTTWFQLLLAQHKNVATTQETHLFDGYLSRLVETWNHWRPSPDGVGMGSILSDDEFHSLCAEFARKVFDKIAAANPAATTVVEKTPTHIRYGELILDLFPDAYFLHLVRDPRSVVSSLCAAGRSWGSHWASGRPVNNVRVWLSDVNAGRKIGTLTDRYREVRYEDLKGPAGAETLEGIFSWLELPADKAFCRQALQACSIERLKKESKVADGVRGFDSVMRSPKGFYRKGRVDSWKDDLPSHDIRLVEYLARDLMAAYGYEPVVSIDRREGKPARLSASEILEGLEWRTRRSVRTVFGKALSAL